jgi:hypothetical protein
MPIGENRTFSVSGHIAPKSMQPAERAGSQSAALVTRTFYIDKGGQPSGYCLSRTTRALMTSNFASTNNTFSLSMLLCRQRLHASEVQQLFSTRCLSDVSWGKVRSLTE